MKKFISMILAICLLCGGLVCIAQEQVQAETRDSAYFASYGTTLSREGNGKIRIVFSTHATGIASTLGVVNYEVERKNDDGDWVDCSGLLAGRTVSNMGSYTFSKYFYGVSGETYRVKVTFICIMNGGFETKAYTSVSLKAT